ncbi:MAG: hypothetical protein EOO19_08925 [Chryseobacterium sp.]|nr:MAG: hypothetical protein EOO19_08925 [Chryseobacterium sp.]
MRNLFFLFTILTFISCSKPSNDYEVINTFFDQHKIRLKNLSSEPFYLNEALKHWNRKEFEDLDFEIFQHEKYTIDTSLVKNKYPDSRRYCKTRISKPLFSKDKKRALLAVEEDCGSESVLTIFLLKKEQGKYIFEEDISSQMSLTH